MIYGFAYLGMVLAISAGWIFLAVLKKPDFIEKPLSELKNKIRPFPVSYTHLTLPTTVRV